MLLAVASPLLPVVVGLGVGLGVLIIVYSLAGLRGTDLLSVRLGPAPTANAEAADLGRPLLSRTLRPLLDVLARIVGRLLGPARLNKTATRLLLAGNPGSLSAAEFFALRALLGIVGLTLGAIIGGSNPSILLRLAFPLGIGALGFVLPSVYLSRKIRQRQALILRAVPDALDLITIAVRAGLSFDGALAKVVEKTSGPLAEEFRRALTEIRVGRPRREALRDISNRTDVPALNSFIGAIIQAEQLGVPIARVLQVQSDQLRIERRQRAEEVAAKAPIKMIFPLVGCIFPALFVVILGPAIVLLVLTMTGR